jgi:hypothetical protein
MNTSSPHPASILNIHDDIPVPDNIMEAWTHLWDALFFMKTDYVIEKMWFETTLGRSLTFAEWDRLVEYVQWRKS